MCGGGGGDHLGEEVREGIPRGQGKRAWDLDPCHKNRCKEGGEQVTFPASQDGCGACY